MYGDSSVVYVASSSIDTRGGRYLATIHNYNNIFLIQSKSFLPKLVIKTIYMSAHLPLAAAANAYQAVPVMKM